jgi:hypothetical protein
VIECLPSKCEALSLNPSIDQKKKIKKIYYKILLRKNLHTTFLLLVSHIAYSSGTRE